MKKWTKSSPSPTASLASLARPNGRPLGWRVRVFGYVRVSTDEQARGGVSLEMQRERISAYAASQGWKLVRIFEDAGHSGTTLERPGLRHGLEEAPLQPCLRAAGPRARYAPGALVRFWYFHGHWGEGRGWLERVLARSSDVPGSVLPKALRGAAYFAWHQDDMERATALSEKNLALCQELGDKEGSAWATYLLGLVALHQSDTKQANAWFEESLDLCHELGMGSLGGLVLAQLGWVPYYQGDYERAAVLLTESLALLREAGGKWGIAYALRNVGRVSLRQSDYERAAASFTESLVLCRQVGDRWVTEECLEGLASLASAQGHYEPAARLFGAAEVWREVLGQASPRDRAYHDKCVASTRTALSDVTFTAAWTEGRAMTLEQAIEYALAVEAN